MEILCRKAKRQGNIEVIRLLLKLHGAIGKTYTTAETWPLAE